ANLVDSLSVTGIGVSIAGIVTATSFVGSGANLSGIDISAVKDSGGNVKIQAEASGAIYTGIHTFGSTTSFTNGVFNGTVTSTGAVVNGDSDLNGDLDVDGHTNLDNVSIAGVTTTTENINIDADNKRLQIGDGQDFKLYHDGSHSYIDNDTGHITVTASQINLNNQDNSENCATFVGNGAVSLFYNGNAKISTTNSGISVTGNATVSGNLSVGGVLTYEDVTNIDSVGIITARSSIKLDADGSSSSNFLSIGADDDLKIFHQSNVDKIESSANGLHIRQINNGDLHIHAGANTGSSNNRFVARAAGAAELYHSGTKKLETRSNGITV
ncbi:MAG: hypothetical protein VXY93_12690, partial [Pseudomonadota bacterium]|nr:hypothetical protein [Pseudomonadota bacterium]